MSSKIQMKMQYKPRPLSSVATTAGFLYKNIPPEIMVRIYGFDSTYHNIYKKKMEEMEWNNLIQKNIKFNLLHTIRLANNLFDIYSDIHKQYICRMNNIIPYLMKFGFKSKSFDSTVEKNKWWFDDSCYRNYNMQIMDRFMRGETGLYWNTMIWVSIRICTDSMNPKLLKTAEMYKNISYDVSYNVKYIPAKLLETSDYIIEMNTNWTTMYIRFPNVKISLDPYLYGDDTDMETEPDEDWENENVFWMD